MKAFLSVSGGPGAVEGLREPFQRALARLAGDTAPGQGGSAGQGGPAGNFRVDESADGWVAFGGDGDDDLLAEPGGAFTVRLSRAARTRQRDVPTADLPALIGTGSAMVDLLPPFAVAHRSGPGAPVVVAGDWLGCRQLYTWRGAGVAAVSTSARALSVLAGGDLDAEALGAQALLGWQLGQATVFQDVRALPPATVATLHGGNLTERRYADAPTTPARPAALDDVVEEMAAVLSDWHTGYLAEHPDSVLQLSGGQDSRVLLAAIPTELRRGLSALTLGDDHSPDVVVARRLATRYGMRHQVYRLDAGSWPDPAQTHELALRAAGELECQASPLALAPLLLAEAQLAQGHRLSGIGGEVARGFYYPGQPADAQTSPRLVERLAQWRLFANEAVAAEALEPEFVAQARKSTLATLNQAFPPGGWLAATDHFYLLHRTHRWGGAHGTVAAERRYAINPLLDRRFVELALAAAPQDKRGGRLWGRLTSRLDPDAARVPLDSGLVPARLGAPTAVSRLTDRALTTRKLARKVHQRLTGTGRAQFGAGQVSAAVLGHWRADPRACAGLFAVPVVRREWLTGLLAGQHTAAPATVAFLVNLLEATRGAVR